MKRSKVRIRRLATITLAAVISVTSIPTNAYGMELLESDILSEDLNIGQDQEELPVDTTPSILTEDINGLLENTNGSAEDTLLQDYEILADDSDIISGEDVSSGAVVKGGYIEMPWDDNAPAADDDLTWKEAINGIVDDTGEGMWVPENNRYVSEPETVQARFPDYDNEKDILKYFTDTYPATRSQSPYGTCWAHSAVALTEFYMLNKGLKDAYGIVVNKNVNYSELQLAYFCYHNSPNPLLDTGDTVTFNKGAEEFLDFGGNLGFASQSMMRYNGVTDEEDGSTAYSNAKNVLDNGLADEYAHGHNQAYLRNEYEVNLKENPKLAKQAILENGIIGASFYWNDRYLADDGKSFYNNTDNRTNHAVAIVGWNDNYSRSNFKTDPGKDGAWLIRNSWTTTPAVSSYSYFWLSYADTSLNSTAYVFEIADRDRGEVYDNNYYYDSQLHNILHVPTGKVANVFTAQKSSEVLKAVSFDITQPSSASIDYSVKIYKNLTNDANPESGILADTVTGTLPFAGKYTIPLNTDVQLSQGETFSIVVDTGNDRIDQECDLLWNEQVNMDTNINSGESFYLEGSSWKDMTLKSSNGSRGNACIRALTNNTSNDLPANILNISTISITSDSVTIKWSAANGADSYQVLRAQGDGAYSVIGTVTGEVRKYEDTGLADSTEYKYMVYPVKNGVASPSDASPELAVRTRPAVPELTVTDIGGYTARVTWTEVKGCDGYRIRWIMQGSSIGVSCHVSETEYRIDSLTPEKEYTVEVYPYTGDGELRSYSNPGSITFTTGAGNPVAVSNLKATPSGTTSIKLTWDELDDVAYYNIERSDDEGANYTCICNRLSDIYNYYPVYALNNATKYTFRVTAVYTEDNNFVPVIKAVSEPISAYPKLSAVSNLKVTASFADKSMTVTWNGVGNASYYAVYRKMSSESEYIPLATIPASDELSYTDTTVTPGRYYYYRVFGCRENILTNEQGSTPTGYGNILQLEKVGNVQVTPRSTSATVSWDPATGADSYKIEQYKNYSWKDYMTVTGGSVTSGTFTGLEPNKSYKFRISAQSDDGAVSVYLEEGAQWLAYTNFNFTTPEDDRIPLSKENLSFQSSLFTYDGQPYSATVTTNVDEVANAGLTLTYAPVTNGNPGVFSDTVPVNAGTYQVKVQTQPTENYRASSFTDEAWRFTINRASLTVTARDNSIIYGEIPAGNGVDYSGFVNSETASDLSGKLSYSYDYSKSGNIGEYSITPTGLTGTNYDISFVPGKLTVKAKEVTVTAQDANDVTYNGSERTGSKVYTFNGLLEGHKGTITYSPAKGTITGTYMGSFGDDLKVMNGSTDVTSNYVLKSKIPGKLTIVDRTSKYAITVEANSLSAVYDGTQKSASGFKTLSFTMNGHPYTVEGLITSSPSSKDVCSLVNSVSGTAVVRDQNNNDVTAQFDVTTKNGSLKITKRALTVTANDSTITYGDTPSDSGVEYSGLANGDLSADLGTITYEYSYEHYGNAGSSYTITPGGLSSDNYEISYVSGRLTVEKKETGLSWSDTPLIYNGYEQVPSVTVTGLVNNDAVSAVVTGGRINAGSGYIAVAEELNGAKAVNYRLPAVNTFTYAIGRAAYGGSKTISDYVRSGRVTTDAVLNLPVLPEGASYAAGGTTGGAQALISAHTVSGTVLTYSTTAQPDGTEATITIGVTGAVNYEDYNVIVRITAKDRDDALVTLNGGEDRSVIYGMSDFDLVAVAGREGEHAVWTWTSSNSDVAAVGEHTGGISIKKSGTTTITAMYESDTTIGSASILLTVCRKPLEIEWSNTSFVYDGNPHKPAAAPANLERGDICIISVAGEQINAGSYTATALISGEAGEKYELRASDAVCDFTIARASLTGAGITLGEGLTYNGSEQTQTIASVEANGTELANDDYTISGNTGINAGTYTLTVTAKDGSNYTGAANRQFTIARKAITPVVSVTGTYSYSGEAIIPVYSVMDGVNPLAGTDYSVTLMDNVNAGQGKITITAADGGNYSFSDVTQVFDIKKASHADGSVSFEVKYGSGAYKELAGLIEAGASLAAPSVLSGEEVLNGNPSVSGTGLNVAVKSDHGLTGSEAVIGIPVYGALNYLDYNIIVTVKVIPDESYSELIEDLKKDDGNKDVQVSSNTVQKGDGSTDTTITVGGKDVAKVTVDGEGKVSEETKIWVSGLKDRYHYTGTAIEPKFNVYDGTKKLNPGTDYSVKFRNNKAVGKSAEIILVFKGSYSATSQQMIRFEIAPAVIGEDIKIEDMGIVGNNRIQMPVPTIIMKATGKKLSKNNFRFSYRNSAGEEVSGVREAGEYTVTVTPGNSSYVENTTKTTAKITVTDKEHVLSKAVVKLAQNKPKKFTYTGAELPGNADRSGRYILTIKKGRDETVLREGEDYTVEYSNNVNPGNALVTFTGIGGYAGTRTVTFKIEKGRRIDDTGDIKVAFADGEIPAIYAKGGAKPEILVRDSGKVLTLNKDYTISYSRNKAVTNGETAIAKVKGKGNYKGEVTLKYSIVKQDINVLKENALVSDKVKTKRPDGYKNPVVQITDLDGGKLKAKRDYTIGDDYTGPDADGYVTVSIFATDNGNYKDSFKVKYRYIDADKQLSRTKVMHNIPVHAYTGREITLTNDELKDLLYTGNKKTPDYLIPDTDFTVLYYTNNVKKGTAGVTVKGIGNYGGTKTITFKIGARKGEYAGALKDGRW